MAILIRPPRLPPRRGPASGRRRAGLAGAAMLCLAAAAPTRAEPSLEMAVKATYLYKLAPFVSWPAQAWSAPNAPLLICVQGADPFGPLLDQAVSGQAVAGHPVEVRRLARLDAGSGCQIAYVAGGPGQSQAQALSAVSGAPVLTVTDEGRGGAAKGIVHLVIDAGKVRFSIDAAQADRNGVSISSKLLALAVAVKR
ncbi:YfiR family protein [Phenylobacterium sp.]|uniref:YfiR family protein n=1 Tax=Phenylobacterium sp. TaxID=1871053 RepID=UPI0012077D32|nr:YfiR family protein [Phenylobacterium sp.]THD71164.1 MAG: YfiR family protein [Phenylobacterium sp.]